MAVDEGTEFVGLGEGAESVDVSGWGVLGETGGPEVAVEVLDGIVYGGDILNVVAGDIF